MKAKVTFSTTEYETGHGRKPRGRGAWGFRFDDGPETFWHNGTYGEAKRAARVAAQATAAEHGLHEIWVDVLS